MTLDEYKIIFLHIVNSISIQPQNTKKKSFATNDNWSYMYSYLNATQNGQFSIEREKWGQLIQK